MPIESSSMATLGSLRAAMVSRNSRSLRKYGRAPWGSSVKGGTVISPRKTSASSRGAAISNSSSAGESGATPLFAASPPTVISTRTSSFLPGVRAEINVGGEAAKSGVAPDSPALEELLIAAPRLEAVVFRGLMTVPPFTDDPEGARPYFRKLRELRDTIAARKLPGVSMDELSMGMSHDFEVAIEEGSTCVRVGTAIFGERLKP